MQCNAKLALCHFLKRRNNYIEPYYFIKSTIKNVLFSIMKIK